MHKRKNEFYKALLQRDATYEGIFYVGIKTTGVFCRPTCPARKPLLENCEFFETAKEALISSYRPCKRCKPLSHPDCVSDLVRTLVEAVEAEPDKKWTDADFRKLSVHATTARRQFKKRFGMTFVQYARARRMGLALNEIKKGESVMEAQVASGYESGSGFRDAFSKIMGEPPVKAGAACVLMASWFDTPLGPMLAVGDEKHLLLLEFAGRRGLEKEIERLRKKEQAPIVPGKTEPLANIEKELGEYFSGRRHTFQTDIRLMGTPFQKKVWRTLMEIPYGTTVSYQELAEKVGSPRGCRAVARANGANQLALIIPCHRVINKGGALGGYGGGIDKKEWLLTHEKKMLR